MTKDRKLHQYRHKDYGDDVGFPVEIVGRDGVVRRYDFEASVRLYERRAALAGVRYADPELAAAEVRHCRARIAQLRRSFFHRHGWAPRPEGDDPETVDEGLAAHVAALLQRTLRRPGRVEARFSRVPCGRGSTDRWCWYVQLEEGRSLLLEVMRRDTPEGRAKDQARRLELALAARGGGDAERLVAESACETWALRLTGRAEDVAVLAASVPGPTSDTGARGGAWEEVLDLVRKGDTPTAFLRCRWLVQRRPLHRDAYALGAHLAVALDREGDAEDLTFVGLRFLPDDPEIRLARARARMRRGQRRGAEADLDAALETSPEFGAARVFQVLLLARRGAWWAAWRALQIPTAADEDGRPVRELRAVVRTGGMAAAALLLGAFVLLSIGLAGLGAALAGLPGLVVGMGGVAWWVRRRVAAIVDRADHEPVAVLLSRLRRRPRSGGTPGTSITAALKGKEDSEPDPVEDGA